MNKLQILVHNVMSLCIQFLDTFHDIPTSIILDQVGTFPDTATLSLMVRLFLKLKKQHLTHFAS